MRASVPASGDIHVGLSGGAKGSGVGSGSGAGVAPKADRTSPPDNFAVGEELKGETPEVSTKLTPSPRTGATVGVPSSSETVEVESQAARITATPETQLPDQSVESQNEQPAQNSSSPALAMPRVKSRPASQDASSTQRTSPKWSISADGALQHSFDGGATWEDVDVNSQPISDLSMLEGTTEKTEEYERRYKDDAQRGSKLVFRAVTVFGTEVWAGGSAAMLYHSDDSGAHWVHVTPSSSGATLKGDITSIEFSDTQHGSIATSAGEIWITTDDGRTWRRE